MGAGGEGGEGEGAQKKAFGLLGPYLGLIWAPSPSPPSPQPPLIRSAGVARPEDLPLTCGLGLLDVSELIVFIDVPVKLDFTKKRSPSLVHVAQGILGL